MRSVKLALIAGLLSLGSAANALTYTFSAAPDNGWAPFSFSFNTPTFLAAGDPIPLVPFTITNGSFSYLIDSAASTTQNPQGRCFLFGTGSQVFANGPDTVCSLFTPPSGDADMWFFDGVTSLPTTLGLTSGLYVAVFSSDVGSGQDFDATLNISNVPEPETWVLIIGGFAITGIAMRRRRSVTVAA